MDWHQNWSGSASRDSWGHVPIPKGVRLLSTPQGKFFFPPTAESFGVSAQIGSGVVRGGPEARFHRVPPRFHQGSTRAPSGFCEGSARAAGWCEH